MKNAADRNASLVEALQALASEMAKAGTEAEADAGLKKLRQIRTDFLGKENGPSAVNAARRDAESLIAWLEARLEQLRLQLARKRRSQEGEVMEQIAKQREAEGPSLLPTELVDAVVHSTASKDPEEPTSSVPETETPKPEKEPAEKRTPPKEKREKAAQREQKPETVPLPRADASEKPEWGKYERLAAHMAASVGEDPKYFDKLRDTAKRGKALPLPKLDNPTAEAHYRSLHDLSKRLVNLELHARAIVRARERQEPVSPLLRTASREIKGFLRDFQAAKAERPALSAEYEQRFGGWAEQFAAMKPEKGSAILDQCRAERQAKQPAAEKKPEQEADAPQLVLKREDYWQQ